MSPRPAPPLVSVVMPVFDNERFVGEAIDSVLSQSLESFELIVVDDCSRDGTMAIVRERAADDPRVVIVAHERNQGIVRSRNHGAAEASPGSRYLAVMDGDDVCMPTRFERQVAFLESHPEHALVGGNTLVIDEASREIGARDYPSSYDEIKRVIARYNPIAQPTVMLRRSVLDEVGGYSEAYPRCADYDLWLRIAARHPVANLPEYTLKYRISDSQGKRTALSESLRLTIEIQRKWLLHPAFFRPTNLGYWALEHGLLMLPEPWILRLFKRVTYRSV